jgi:hypothetical protein
MPSASRSISRKLPLAAPVHGVLKLTPGPKSASAVASMYKVDVSAASVSRSAAITAKIHRRTKGFPAKEFPAIEIFQYILNFFANI